MTEHVNVGAATVDGSWIKTKKRLRELLAEDPAEVLFVLTASGGPRIGTVDRGQRLLRASELPQGYAASVAGPDPHANRRWYASVELVDGKPQVVR